MPELVKRKPIVDQEVFQKMKADKVTGDKAFLIAYHGKEVQRIVCFLVQHPPERTLTGITDVR